tara:strand:+ start:8721 stop:8957 length:237 start_codon:yes stop_codon:yes gene_type:complete
MKSTIQYIIQNKKGLNLNHKRNWVQTEKNIKTFDTINQAEQELKTLRTGHIVAENIYYTTIKVNGTTVITSEIKLEKI